MSNINKRQLLNLIHFLPPLLQGIDFSHHDSTLQVHVVSIINISSRLLYGSHLMWYEYGAGWSTHFQHRKWECMRALWKEIWSIQEDTLSPSWVILRWVYQEMGVWCETRGSRSRGVLYSSWWGSGEMSYSSAILLFEVSYFYSRDQEMKPIIETNTSRTETLEYLMDYTKRIGVMWTSIWSYSLTTILFSSLSIYNSHTTFLPHLLFRDLSQHMHHFLVHNEIV